jgi:transposase
MESAAMGFGPLLPDSYALSWGRVHVLPERVTITLRTSSPVGRCPLCKQPSSRVHSRYRRTLADLPWHGTAVRLLLRARRFFCDNAMCRRKIFTEQLPGLAAAYARRTRRFSHTLEHLGFACGGEGGARLARLLGMPVSPDTVLRQLRAATPPKASDVRILGVDDWALRRGQRYGTILCDLERHRPIGLLPDRSAETLAAWLRNRPGIEVISRDRASCYSQGAALGAPQAVQVADRWHLMHNLHDALVRMLDRRHRDLHAAAKDVISQRQRSPPKMNNDVAAPHETQVTKNSPPHQPLAGSVPRTRREKRYHQVIALHRRGMSQRAIARRLGIHRETVARFIHAGQFPERAPRPYGRKTDPFVDYLWNRWQQGCRNAAQLTRELESRGFVGSYAGVQRQLARWRRADPQPTSDSASASCNRTRRPSPRRLAWLMLRERKDLNPENQALMRALFRRCPDLKLAARLGREFTKMIRHRRPDKLDAWIDRAQQVDVPQSLRTFAAGLNADYAAVRAALMLSWSNGQVEGQVNRLKLLKRQMYGRAGFDLLRLRVLYTG